jgi:non-ribosomal peptide synthetase component F
MIGSWETQLQAWHALHHIPEIDARLEQYFQNTVIKFPDRMAVFDLNQNVGMTYQELNAKSDLLAQRLFRTLKDHDHKIILVFLDPGILFPQVVLAILKSGFIFLPVDSNTPIDRIRFIIKDANIKMVVTQGR